MSPADVVILGGSIVCPNVARIAAGLGANVFVLDIDLKRLRYLSDVIPANVTTLMSNLYNLNKLVSSSDLLIGAVLHPGAKAPRLVARQMISEMKEGAVILDFSVDQGGCVETCKPTTYANPTFVVAAGLNVADGRVVHSGVAEAWGLDLTPLSDVLN